MMELLLFLMPHPVLWQMASKQKFRALKILHALHGVSQSLFSLGEKNIYEQGNYVDPGFLSMFQLRFIKGNAANAFSALYSIVISETMADKFFGTTNVIGKTLKVDNKQDYVISGVIETCLRMSHSNLTGWLLLKFMKIKIHGCRTGATMV